MDPSAPTLVENELSHLSELSERTSLTPTDGICQQVENYFDIREFTSGCLTGVSIVLTGNPLDCLKTRLQTNFYQNQSPFFALTSTLKNEGFFAFYKGALAPLSTVPLVNAIVFASFEFGKRALLPYFQSKNELSITGVSLAGAFAGFVNSFVVSPIELLKCRMMVNSSLNSRNHYLSMTKQIVMNQGILGLFRGLVATLVRETPCYATQFGVYEYVKRSLTIKYYRNAEKAPDWINFVAGGCGGLGCWVISYPQDVICSRLRCQPLSKQLYRHRFFDGGMIECAKQLYRENGIKTFWKGFTPCAARAILANAVGFEVYEISSEWLNSAFPRKS